MSPFWFVSTNPSYREISQNRVICIYNCPITLKLDRHLRNSATDVPVKSDDLNYQSCGFKTSQDVMLLDVLLDIETAPWP